MSPGWSKPLPAGKTYTKTSEKTQETKKRSISGFKPLPIVNIGTNINEEEGEEDEEEETEKGAQGWTKPLHALKTYTRTAEKTQESKKKSFTCSKPLPIVKTGSLTPEETPGKSPFSTVKTPDFTCTC